MYVCLTIACSMIATVFMEDTDTESKLKVPELHELFTVFLEVEAAKSADSYIDQQQLRHSQLHELRNYMQLLNLKATYAKLPKKYTEVLECLLQKGHLKRGKWLTFCNL